MDQSKIPYSEVAASPREWQHPQDTMEQPDQTPKTSTSRWPRSLKLTQPALAILVLAVVPIVLLVVTQSNFLSTTSFTILFDSNMPCDVSAPWTSWGGLFGINARTGAMSFAEAKGIDLVWDLLVGQGLRAILALLAWRVYGEALIRIMEEEAMSYEMFTSVALSNVSDTYRAIYQTLRWIKSSRTKWMLVWMSLSISYLIIFPALLSACTSYVAVSERAVRLVDNATALFDDYVNHTASLSYDFHNGSAPWIVNLMYYEAGAQVPCDIFTLADHAYTAGPGNSTAIQVNSTVYNVTGATVTCGFDYQGHFYLANNNTQTWTGTDPIGFVPRDQWICQPGDGYQWGFSYQVMLLVIIVHTIWSLMLYAVWIDGQRHSAIVRDGHRLGRWKAILELAEPLRNELGAKTSSRSQTELEGQIRRLRPIKYVTTQDGPELVPESDKISSQIC